MKNRLLMSSHLVALLVLGMNVDTASAAIYHVRAGAAGNASGVDWNNAYPALPTTLSRGSTYYVASGIYGGYTFNTAESGTSVVTVKKATVLDHGSSVGWSDDYGSGSAVFTNYWRLTRGYFTLDGQVGGGPGNWTNGFGFKIQSLSTNTFNSGITISANRRNVTLRHFEIQGNGGDGDGGLGGPANDALDIGTGTDQTIVSYAYLHDMGRWLIFGHGNNMFFEYVYGGKFESTAVEHAEIASLWASIPPVALCTNVTFANCVWSHMEGTGGLIMYADGVKIYGNVFYRPAGKTFPPANGALATWSNPGSVFVHGRIFNNSFINLGSTFPALGIGFGESTGDNLVMNNVFYNCRVDFGGVALHDYNLFINSTGAAVTTEAHGTTATSAVFNDYNALNFTLKNNTGAGTNVGSPYNLDPHGNLRTTWTRGAFEYGSALANPFLRIQRASNLLLFSWAVTPADYRLCSSTNLNNWIILTNSPVLSDNQWALTLPLPAAQRQFYRLRKAN